VTAGRPDELDAYAEEQLEAVSASEDDALLGGEPPTRARTSTAPDEP